MKLFTNKNVVQKIAIAILIVLSVSFIVPKCVRATAEEVSDVVGGIVGGVVNGNVVAETLKSSNDDLSTGGMLFKPVSALLFGVGKTAISLLQDWFYMDESTKKTVKAFDDNDNPHVFYSPATIISGKVPLFDINFISPKEKKRLIGTYIDANVDSKDIESADATISLNAGESTTLTGLNTVNYFTLDIDGKEYSFGSNGKIDVTHGGITIKSVNNSLNISVNDLATQKINHIIKLINPYSPEGYKKYNLQLNGGSAREEYIEQEMSTPELLKNTIASWYAIIRNIAIIGLLLVLIYVGIRIIISSTAAENAKYKKMLIDWLVALCLIFVLHYIMSFAISITETITEALTENVITSEGDITMNNAIKGAQGNWGNSLFGYTIIFLVMVCYTFYFTYTYLRRSLYLAFLTVIAPLVCLTYPLDKIKDGQAQAFNMWLREYIFNLLIQPVHLVLYTVLVLSAEELMKTNLIFAIVAIGFILPAEKFIRKMFGFEKAGTLGTIGAATGGALIMNAVNSIGKKGKGSGNNSSSGDKGIKTKTQPSDKMKVEDAFGVGTDRTAFQQTGGSNSTAQTARGRSRRLPNGEIINTNGNTSEAFRQNNEKQEFLNSRKAEIEKELGNPNLSDKDKEMLEQDLENVNNQIRTPENIGNTTPYSGLPEGNTANEDFDDTGIYYEPLNQNIIDPSYQASSEPEYDLGFEFDSPKQTDVNEEELNMSFSRREGIAGLFDRAGDNFADNREEIAKNAVKRIVGVAGAATLGSVALAAGIATGDVGNSVKFTSAGIMAGAVAGTGITENANSKIKKLSELYKEGGYGGAENYAKIKAQKEFMKNRGNRRYFREQLGVKSAEDLDKCMKLAAKYNRFGVTELKDIRKGIKLQKEFKISDKKAISAIKTSKYITQDVLTHAERRTGYENHYISRIGNKNTEELFKYLDKISEYD